MSEAEFLRCINALYDKVSQSTTFLIYKKNLECANIQNSMKNRRKQTNPYELSENINKIGIDKYVDYL